MNWDKFVKKIACGICHRGIDVPSPRDITSHESIKYRNGKVVIEGILPDVWLTGVQDTNSMDGLLDYGHTVILSNNPSYLEFVEVGDVIVWEAWGQKVIHQVIKIDRDGRWYAKTKGINCPVADPYKIRREMVRYLALGIIW